MIEIQNNYIPADLFTTIVHNVPICTVDVLFFDISMSKILLFKRNNKPLRGEYQSCGGRLYKNENFEDCAVRITANEMGIAIDKNELLQGGVINEIFETSNFANENYHTINIYYAYILTKDLPLNFDNQHSGSKWFSITEKNIFHHYLNQKIETCLLHQKK